MQPVHHITYDFRTEGLSPAAVAFHIEDAKDALSEHFGIERSAVNIRKGPGVETDVSVMTGTAGKTNCELRKIAAMRVVYPLLRYLHEHAGVTAARESGFQQVVLTLVKPRAAAGVANG